MNCPVCGRALAAGAKKCVFCGDGTKFRAPQQLAVPKGSTRKPGGSFPWGKILFVLILGGAVAAAFLHPDLNAKIKELFSRF